jgi:hypothetical protein
MAVRWFGPSEQEIMCSFQTRERHGPVKSDAVGAQWCICAEYRWDYLAGLQVLSGLLPKAPFRLAGEHCNGEVISSCLLLRREAIRNEGTGILYARLCHQRRIRKEKLDSMRKNSTSLACVRWIGRAHDGKVVKRKKNIGLLQLVTASSRLRDRAASLASFLRIPPRC